MSDRSKIEVRYTYSPISFSALSTASEPWQMLRPTARAKSPRMVPNGYRMGFLRVKHACQADVRTGSRGKRVSSAEHDTAGLDGIETLPDHGDDGARGHVLDEAREEGLALEVSVVCTYVTVINEAPCM